MDLSKLSLEPVEYKLRDVSIVFAEQEDAQAVEFQARVSVRPVVTSDDIRRAELLVEKHVKYVNPDTLLLVDETVGFNARAREMYEVYWSLWSVSGLQREGVEIFPQSPIVSMPLPLFEQAWNSLPLFVTDAIHDAVIFTNPRWATE